MGTIGRFMALLLCISQLLVGCFSSETIRPDGNEREAIFSKSIKRVVTKDGTEYRFDKPPTVAEEIITGEAKIRVPGGIVTKHVNIPVSDVDEALVSETNWTWTGLLIGFVAFWVAGIIVCQPR